MRNILLFLLAFLGLGAAFGGAVLIISPSGKLFGMPLSMLDKSPFYNFLLPGIILFLVLGFAPIALIFALLKKPDSKFAERFNFFWDMHWSWAYSIYIAFALIIWIQVEMFYLQSVHWSHTFYMFYAIVIIFTALLPKVRHQYKKKLPMQKLTAIKTIHTVIWFFFNIVIFYMLYAVIIRKLDVWLWVCYGLIFMECITLLIFKLRCPLTLVARKYSNSTKDNFDIYLPNWLARYNKLIYTVILIIIIIATIYRLLN